MKRSRSLSGGECKPDRAQPRVTSKSETTKVNSHKKAQKSQKAFRFLCVSCDFLWPFPFTGDFDVSLRQTISSVLPADQREYNLGNFNPSHKQVDEEGECFV